MNAPAAELRDVQVVYHGRPVLDVPSFSIESGVTLTVIGPNGSGKSTMLKLLALLERPTRGQVLHNGQAVTNGGNALRRRRRLALVMQQPLLRNVSTWENVATGLRFRHSPRNDTRRQVEYWLEKLGIAHLAERNARSLSAGEAQRASLARALVLEPELLLMDEPFTALDPPTRQSLLDDLHDILDDVRTTTVFVTHDRGEAQVLGDRLAVLIDGRLRQVGSPDEVFSTPDSEEVASFVGVENILSGRVTRQSDDLATVTVGQGQVTLVGRFTVGEELVMGVRPEVVVLEPVSREDARTSALNRLRGPIVRIVPQGALARVEVDCGFPLVSLVTRESVLNLELSPGAHVLAAFKATGIHVIRRSHPVSALNVLSR
ncbi:MAG: ABC transporter ATP-binding protein [SAR202 cluster bacterium]|jgi:tungstate transport system ATP-binding protein|nr:ABC transporter ATP-binding protein [SAR202 cluster bacterium]